MHPYAMYQAHIALTTATEAAAAGRGRGLRDRARSIAARARQAFARSVDEPGDFVPRLEGYPYRATGTTR